jgi:hypothetical protein
MAFGSLQWQDWFFGTIRQQNLAKVVRSTGVRGKKDVF